MKTKIFIMGLVCFYSIGFILAQSEESKKRKSVLTKHDIVYVVPGEKIYHLRNCEKLGTRWTGMPLFLAIKKGCSPCPICIPLEEKSKQIKKKTTEIPKSSIEKNTKTEKSIVLKSGFREASWGMTQEQVKKLETSEFFQKQYSKSTGLNILAYKGQAGELECLIAYYFAENQLVEGRYLFIEKHSNDNLYIDDFKKVKISLIEKYGKPTNDNIIWRNDLYKDDPEDWGLAISIGHLAYEAVWKSSKTQISLQLLGDNYKISHRLGYKSEIEEHRKLIKKAAEKAKKAIW